MSSTTYCNIVLLSHVFCAKCSFAAVWQGKGDKSYRKKDVCFPSFGVLIKLTALAEMAKCQFSCKHFAEREQEAHTGVFVQEQHLFWLTSLRVAGLLSEEETIACVCDHVGARIWCFPVSTSNSLWQVALKPSNIICSKCWWKPHGTSFVLPVEYLREDLTEAETCCAAWNVTLCNVSRGSHYCLLKPGVCSCTWDPEAAPCGQRHPSFQVM